MAIARAAKSCFLKKDSMLASARSQIYNKELSKS
jgi:hypothetical protein